MPLKKKKRKKKGTFVGRDRVGEIVYLTKARLFYLAILE